MAISERFMTTRGKVVACCLGSGVGIRREGPGARQPEDHRLPLPWNLIKAKSSNVPTPNAHPECPPRMPTPNAHRRVGSWVGSWVGMWGGQWGGWGGQWGGHVGWAFGVGIRLVRCKFFESSVKGVYFSREQRIAHRLSADPN